MLKIHIVAVGKCKESFYREAAGEYLKRLSRFAAADVRELPERSSPKEEAADVLRAWLAYALLIGDGAQAASLAAEYNNAIARTPLAGMRRLEEKLYAELYGG